MTRKIAGKTDAVTLISSMLAVNAAMLSGCSSKDKAIGDLDDLSVNQVIKLLDKKHDAVEYTGSLEDAQLFWDDQFLGSYYITGEGDDFDTRDLTNFLGIWRGSEDDTFLFRELKAISEAVTDSDCEFVEYREYDHGDTVRIGAPRDTTSNAILIYVEFDDKKDAMDCFDRIMDEAYFYESTSERYSVARYEKVIAETLPEEKERLGDCVLGEYISKNTEHLKAIHRKDLKKDNYSYSSNTARFDYSIHWEVLRMSDKARVNRNDAELIEEYSGTWSGVMGHHLCVSGNKLLLIEGYDHDKDRGTIKEVAKLCETFTTGDPFEVKMSDDLKKQLLYVLKKWDPTGCRLDKF